MMRSSTSRRRGRRGRRQMSEINVTPLVDVMLVLLIVFMVTAPLLATGVSVDLPRTDSRAVAGTDEPLSVTIDQDGVIYLNETPVELAELGDGLLAVSDNNPEIRVFVRGDRGIDYGRVMAVVGTINASGFTRVALLTEAPEVAVVTDRADEAVR